MIALRASSAPRADLCPVSATPASERINWTNQYAQGGTAAHAAFTNFIRTGSASLDEVADENHIEVEDLKRSFNFLMGAWHKVQDWFPSPMVERSMTMTDHKHGITLTGTTDLASLIGDDEIRIADWKTGFLDHDCEAQVRCYCLMGMLEFDRKTSRGMVLNTRLRGGEGWQWSLEELEAWWDKLAERIVSERTPSPGLHCKFCQRWGECPAGRDYVRVSAGAIVELSDRYKTGDSLPMTNDDLIHVAGMRQMVESACDTVQGFLRKEVASRGGEVLSSDNATKLAISTSLKKEIEFARGRQVIADAIGVQEMHQCAKFVKGDVETAVKEKAGRGQKGKAVAELMEQLDQVGAVSAVPVERLTLTRNKGE